MTKMTGYGYYKKIVIFLQSAFKNLGCNRSTLPHVYSDLLILVSVYQIFVPVILLSYIQGHFLSHIPKYIFRYRLFITVMFVYSGI